VADFIAKFDLASEAVRSFQDAVDQALISVEALHAGIDDLPAEHLTNVSLVGEDEILEQVAEIREYVDALPEERTILVRMDTTGLTEAAAGGLGAGLAGAGGAEAAAGALRDEAQAAGETVLANDAASLSASELAKNEYLLAMAARMNANTQQDAAASTVRAAGTTQAAARIFGLTWTTIHWIATGVAEYLAVAIPGTVALLSGAAVALQASVDVAERVMSIYTATEATYSYMGQTTGTVLGLGDALQKAQNAMQPEVYEAFGAAINGAKDNFGQFDTMGEQVVRMLDQFGAKVDIDLKQGLGSSISGLMGEGVQDLREFGQILGNVGHTIVNVAQEMPGFAEVLLRWLDIGSQVLEWLSHFQGALEALFVLHEAYMWGGLFSNMLGSLAGFLGGVTMNLGTFIAKLGGFEGAAAEAGGAVANFGMDVEGAGTFLSGAWGTALVAGVALLGFLIFKAIEAKDAIGQMTSAMEQSVAQQTGLQQIGYTYVDLKAVTAAAAASQQHLSAMMSDTSNTVTGSMTRFGYYSTAVLAAAGQAGELSRAQQQLSRDFSTETGNVAYLAGYYKISYVQAAELAGLAGVNLTQTLKGNSTAAQENLQMVKNLVAGYGGMGAVQGALGDDINAISFATALQSSDVEKLNQSWDTFIQTVQGPSSGFVGFAQSLVQYGSDMKQAGAGMTGLGTGAIAAASHVTTASLQLQSDFNNAVNSAETMIDSLRTAATVTGNGGPLIQGIKDAVAALIPLAGANQGAQAQIYALAQEANGPASGGLQAIAKWAGVAKNPMTDLYTLTGKAAKAMADLGQDSSNLAATIQSTLNQTLVNAAESVTGVSSAVSTYLSDLQQYGPASATTQAALDNVNSKQNEANILASQGAAGVDALTGKYTSAATPINHVATATANFEKALKETNGVLTGATKTALSGLIQQYVTAGNIGESSALSTINKILKAAHDSPAEINAMDKAIRQLWQDMEKMHSLSLSVNVKEYVTSSGRTATSLLNPGYASGTPAASAGWAWVGEAGPELVKFHGGETVVPTHSVGGYAEGAGWYDQGYFPGIGPVLSGASGGSSGGGGLPVLELHLHGDLADKNIWENGQIQTLRYNYRNSGRPTGAVKPS
jgi:hypothetical protein